MHLLVLFAFHSCIYDCMYILQYVIAIWVIVSLID